MPLPAPPTVAAALSGFVVGVIVTLIITGTVATGGSSTPVHVTLPPSTPVADSVMYAKVRRILVRELGAGYPNAKQPRLESLSLVPVAPPVGAPGSQERLLDYRSIFVRFRLNDHPLGRVWRLKTAKADVFLVLKALYTSQLAVYNVQLDGSFPLGGNTRHGHPAMVACIDHHTASRIPWKRWGRENEDRVWLLLTCRYVDPRFA